MEMASFLAGERWSDHPDCTDPVLATLARCVNDMLDDTHRQRLLTMVPEVIGLKPEDRRARAALLLTAARAALPIADAGLPVAVPERRYVMALAILEAEQVLAEQNGRATWHLTEASRAALAESPAAEQWARVQLARTGFSSDAIRPKRAAKVVALAVEGIAQSSVDDRHERLIKLLHDGIEVMAAFSALEPKPDAVVGTTRDPRVGGGAGESTPTRGTGSDLRRLRSLWHRRAR